MSQFKDYFQILGVDPSATTEQIRQAYRERMRFFHPDNYPNDPKRRAVAEQESRNVNEAYETLRNPDLREEYLQDWILFHNSPTAYRVASELEEQLNQTYQEMAQRNAELARLRAEAQKHAWELEKARKDVQQERLKSEKLRKEIDENKRKQKAAQKDAEQIRRAQAYSAQPPLRRPLVSVANEFDAERTRVKPNDSVYPSNNSTDVRTGGRKYLGWMGAALITTVLLTALIARSVNNEAARVRTGQAPVIRTPPTAVGFQQAAAPGLLAANVNKTPVPTFTATSSWTATPTSSSTPSDTPTVTSVPPTPTAERRTDMFLVVQPDPDTPTPTNTPTPKPVPSNTPTLSSPALEILSDTINLRSGPGTGYPVVGSAKRGDVLAITGKDAESAAWFRVRGGSGRDVWVSASPALVSAYFADLTSVVAAPALPATSAPQPTPTNSPQWTLIADSVVDYRTRHQNRRWWYLFSDGRNNFRWKDMSDDGQTCPEAPGENPGYLCADRGLASTYGDVALQWKAQDGGTYLIEWYFQPTSGSGDFLTYRHLEFVSSQGKGPTLPNSYLLEDIDAWQLFFFVLRADSFTQAFEGNIQVRVYRKN